MDAHAIENHKLYEQRIVFYRDHGYDLEKEREFILNTSLPVRGHILEVGTGKGHFSIVLAKRGLRFISVDISGPDQDIARLNLRYYGLEGLVDLRLDNAQSMGFSDRSFDAIFCVNVFHLLEDPSAALGEMVRLLRPSGKIVISDLSDRGLKIINECHSAEGRDHDHLRYNMDTAGDYFAGRGLRVREYQSDCQKVMIAEHTQGT